MKLVIQKDYTHLNISENGVASKKKIGAAVVGTKISQQDKQKLVAVHVPEGINAIAGGAFEKCKWLCQIGLSEQIELIESFAFDSCLNLRNITIPRNVKSIGDGAFEECRSLENILVDPGNKDYSSKDGVLFSHDLKSLIRFPPGKVASTYNIPVSVTKIGSGAFEACASLNEVYIHDSVTEIGEAAFEFCQHLKNIHIPKTVEIIGESAFGACSNLNAVNIENGVLEIANNAFSGTDVEQIIIPPSVAYIGVEAFSSCVRLRQVVMQGRPHVCRNAFGRFTSSILLSCSH